MKLLGNIEVSGIERIVFYSTGEAWTRVDIDEGEPIWVGDNDVNLDRCRSHQEMMNVVRRKINDPINYRIWIHDESMNIVPIEPEE